MVLIDTTRLTNRERERGREEGREKGREGKRKRGREKERKKRLMHHLDNSLVRFDIFVLFFCKFLISCLCSSDRSNRIPRRTEER